MLRNKDKQPATKVHAELIENGLRELGEFWTNRELNQGEARDILKDINNRLQAQRRR